MIDDLSYVFGFDDRLMDRQTTLVAEQLLQLKTMQDSNIIQGVLFSFGSQ